MSASEPLPDFLTVEEAAQILRIGRTAAYGLARQWRATDGREGLPVVSFGRLLRVPRAALEVVAGGPLSRPVEVPVVVDVRGEIHPLHTHCETEQRPRSSRTRNTDDQQSLFAEA